MTTPQPTNWIKHPKTVHLILFIAAWLISTGLSLFVITDSFTDFLFNGGHVLFYVMIISATGATGEVVLNYFRNRK